MNNFFVLFYSINKMLLYTKVYFAVGNSILPKFPLILRVGNVSVMIPVATVTLFSRMVNGSPVVITIFHNKVT